MDRPLARFFFSGTSNLMVPLKQADYPPAYEGASRLTYYASLFSSIEINASFYKLPKRATVEKWRESVPGDFRFTFKVPKILTHNKNLEFSGADVAVFAETVAAAGEKKGCLLLQLPPSCKKEREEELGALLENLSEEAVGWKIAVEFRNVSWHTSGVYRLLQRFGAAMVEHDLPASRTPPVEVSDSFRYIRFHGPEGGYRGSYDDEVLEDCADRVARSVAEGKEVYVYFNNTLGSALHNLHKLNALTEAKLLS
jgi:uncharacterized protein YecE (DUF72 family)